MEVLFFFSLLLVILLLALVFFQQKRIEKLTKPKYGFLGKKLSVFVFALLGVSLLTGGLFTLNRNTSQNGDLSVSEITSNNTNFFKISYQTLENNKIKFVAIPFVNNKPWDGIDKIDIYWEVIPERGISKKILQSSVTQQNNQGITINIQDGRYKIRAMFSDGNIELIGELEIFFSE
jgi:hypothetical protein